MKRLILLGVLVLILAACGGSEEAVKEIVVTREVEVTSVVEVTREVEVTRVVEVTKEVFVVATPTPIPVTPTPQAVIPDGWKTYQIISSGTTFAYPPEWEIWSEETDKISFVHGTEFLYFLGTRNSSSFAQDYETQIKDLKVFLLAGQKDLNNSVVFYQEGKLDAPHTPAYTTATITTKSDNITAGSLFAYATDGDRYAALLFVSASSPNISDETIEMITKIARSVEFH